jgi:transposase
MSDKSDMIYDLLKEQRKETAQFHKEVREAHGEIAERLTRIEVLDEEQNKQLAEHIRRTDLLEGLYKDTEARISKLEEPAKVRSTLAKWIIGLGAIAGAIVSIAKFTGLF